MGPQLEQRGRTGRQVHLTYEKTFYSSGGLAPRNKEKEAAELTGARGGLRERRRCR